MQKVREELKAGAALCAKLTDRCRELEQEIADLKARPVLSEDKVVELLNSVWARPRSGGYLSIEKKREIAKDICNLVKDSNPMNLNREKDSVKRVPFTNIPIDGSRVRA
jgi:hypothetical protein